MMIKVFMLIISLMVSISSIAADLYGLSDDASAKIMKKYGKEVHEFEALIQQAILMHLFDANDGKPETSQADVLKKELTDKKLALMKKITNDNGFLFVDFQIITYPEKDNNKSYMTIEVIDKQHPERLRFINNESIVADKNLKRAHKPDLIESMITYNNIGMELVLNHKMVPDSSACPVYHCAFGFNHPKLKPYLATFNMGVIKERALILKTLNHDPDPERRAAAAYLIGHFRDPHEIILILSPHISDRHEGVRNDVMRVIGATMMKSKINDIDVMPFLDALDSPYTTDRNKALFILFTAVDAQQLKAVILQKGGDQLLALLKLKQPNNHDWAYQILKKMSGKDFGSTNVVAWTKWVTSAQKQSA